MKTTKKFNKISEKRFLNAQFVNSRSVFKNKNNTCNCHIVGMILFKSWIKVYVTTKPNLWRLTVLT